MLNKVTNEVCFDQMLPISLILIIKIIVINSNSTINTVSSKMKVIVDFFLFEIKKIIFCYFLFSLFLERGQGKEKKKKKNIGVWVREVRQKSLLVPLLHALTGTKPTTWLGIKSITFQFVGWHPTHWATLPRPSLLSFSCYTSVIFKIKTLIIL